MDVRSEKEPFEAMNVGSEYTSLSQWLSAIHESHGFDKKITDKPLFSYRCSDDHYQELRRLLIESVANRPFSTVLRSLNWTACMVMFAAEWWRREYSGQWSWAPIFEAIGVPVPGQQEKVFLVVKGLRSWNRPVRIRENGDRMLLGTIAIEAGLPLHQLENDKASISYLFIQTLGKQLSLPTGQATTVSLIIEHEERLPKIYRRDEFYTLFAAVVDAVIDLQKQHDLKGKENPFRYLEDSVSGWMDSFPLPIDSDAGKNILRSLVEESAKEIKKESAGSLPKVRRTLYKHANGQYRVKLVLPTITFLNTGLLAPDSGTEVSRISIDILTNGQKETRFATGLLKKRGAEPAVYTLNSQSVMLTGTSAENVVKLRSRSLGEVLGQPLDLPGSEAMEDESPWLFSPNDPICTGSEEADYCGQGVRSSPQDKAIVVIPEKSVLTAADGGQEAELIGVCGTREVYLIGSSQSVRTDDGDVFSVRVKTVPAQAQHFGFNNLPILEGISPKDIFIGQPGVRPQPGYVTRLNHKSGTNAQSSCQIKYLRYFEEGSKNGSIGFKKIFGILPENFRVSLKPSNDERTGKLVVEGLAENDRICLRGDVAYESVFCAPKHEISVSVTTDPPAYLEMEIYAHGSTQPIVLSKPFPSVGASIFDPVGKRVNSRSSLTFRNTDGYRLRLFLQAVKGRRGKEVSIELQLQDPQNKGVSLKHEQQLVVGADCYEIPLNDFQGAIERLFAATSSLDATVDFSVYCAGRCLLSQPFQRYRSELRLADANGEKFIQVASNVRGAQTGDASPVKLLARSLAKPSLPTAELTPVVDDDVFVGKWLLPPNIAEIFPCFIYAEPDSGASIRPLLMCSRGSGAGVKMSSEGIAIRHSLRTSARIDSGSERRTAIKSAIPKLATDWSNSDWDYLLELLEFNVPLTAFDSWVAVSKNAAVLTTLFCKVTVEQADRITKQLSILWEALPLQCWLTSINTAIGEYAAKFLDFPPEDALQLLDCFRESLYRTMEKVEPNLSYVVDVHRNSLSDKPQPLGLMVYKSVEDVTNRLSDEDKLLVNVSDPDSTILSICKALRHQLLRTHKDALSWPPLSLANADIFDDEPFISMLLSELESGIDRPWDKRLVLIAPVLTAVLACATDSEYWHLDPKMNYDIRTGQDFEPEWFDGIYRLVVAKLVSTHFSA